MVYPSLQFLRLATFTLALFSFLIFLSYVKFLNYPVLPSTTYKVNIIENNTTQKERGATTYYDVTLNDLRQLELFDEARLNGTTRMPNPVSPVLVKAIYQSGQMSGNPKICPDSGKDIKLLILVTSAPSRISARLAIRKTWGHFALRKDVAVAFLLGATRNETINNLIEQEEGYYDDIIRGNFADTYDTLTLKTVAMLEWVSLYCAKARFVLKADDDVFINVARLLAFIAKRRPEARRIYGRLAQWWKPVRKKSSKYYVYFYQYKLRVFPDFTTGPAYLFPARLSMEMYEAALNHAFFKLEDVFLTGLIAKRLWITRVHVKEFLNQYVWLTVRNIQRHISIHMVEGAEQFSVWNKMHSVM